MQFDLLLGTTLLLKVHKLVHCFIILLHNLALQFVIQYCFICLRQNLSCDVTAPFAGVKNFVVCQFPFSHNTVLFCLASSTFLDHSAPVSCQVQQHWRSLSMFLLQTFIPRTLCIYWGVLWEFFASPQDKKNGIADDLHFSFDKKWYHVLNSLQMTFSVFFPICRYQIFQYIQQLQ